MHCTTFAPDVVPLLSLTKLTELELKAHDDVELVEPLALLRDSVSQLSRLVRLELLTVETRRSTWRL